MNVPESKQIAANKTGGRHWNEINDAMPCPISITRGDIREHLRDRRNWDEDADWWSSKQGLVSRDGWTTNELYERLMRDYKEYMARDSYRGR